MPMTKKPIAATEAAEQLAILGLNYLASDPEILLRFLEATGLGPQTLREAARDPAFLASVLRYMTQDESLLLAFAANVGVEPGQVAAADAVLSPDAYGGFM